MNTDLEQDLRDLATSTTGVSLGRSVGDVLDRGNRLRRRRRGTRIGLATATAVGVLGATLGVAVLPDGGSPLVPRADAAWGPEAVNLPADALAAATRACREGLTRQGWPIPDAADPVAADTGGGTTTVFFREGVTEGGCELNRVDDATYTVGTASFGRLTRIPPGEDLEPVFTSAQSEIEEASGAETIVSDTGIVRVSPRVDRLTVAVAGATYTATVDHGLGMYLLTGSHPADDPIVLTAYDARGTVIDTDRG